MKRRRVGSRVSTQDCPSYGEWGMGRDRVGGLAICWLATLHKCVFLRQAAYLGTATVTTWCRQAESIGAFCNGGGNESSGGLASILSPALAWARPLLSSLRMRSESSARGTGHAQSAEGMRGMWVVGRGREDCVWSKSRRLWFWSVPMISRRQLVGGKFLSSTVMVVFFRK